MSFRPPDFIIDPDDPFKHDRLNRRARVESLCQRVLDDPGPLAVAVNGDFGSGKSVFLRMCAAHLRKSNAAVYEFDAWQESHTNSPIIDLVSALKKREAAFKKLLKIAVDIASDMSAVVEPVPGIGSTVAWWRRTRRKTDRESSQFDAWQNVRKQREEFHAELQKAAVKQEHNIVVLVDELDRCFPHQALQVLNVIRHLFDVSGVVVIVAVNQLELEHRVKQIYGQDSKADVFLARFWDLPITLQPAGLSALDPYLNTAIEGAGISHRLNMHSDSYSYPMLRLLVERTGMSLRDIQQALHYLAAVLTNVADPSEPSGNPLDGRRLVEQMVLAAFALRVVHRETYDDLISGNCDGFFAVSVLRKELEIESENVVGVQMTALLLSVSLDVRFVETADDFVSRFAAEQVGGEALARQVWVACKDAEPYLVGWSPTLDRLERVAQPAGLEGPVCSGALLDRRSLPLVSCSAGDSSSIIPAGRGPRPSIGASRQGMRHLRLRRLLTRCREQISLRAWLLLLPAVLLLAMAAAAAFLAWEGFTLLNRDDLATLRDGSSYSGAGSRPELGRHRVLGRSDRVVRVPRPASRSGSPGRTCRWTGTSLG